MTPFPITVCLFTTTKGHFNRDTYQQTVSDLLSQVPGPAFARLLSNVKADVNNDPKQAEMSQWLGQRGFDVIGSVKPWRHDDSSHQIGFLEDMTNVVGEVDTQYMMLLEDDWVLRVRQGSLDQWLAKAIEILEENPDVLQVRIPRWENEFDRINGLRAKHGIDGQAERSADSAWFRQNDWSNHPSIIRARDFNAALRFVWATNLPRHSEHGLGAAMKLLSPSRLPFVCLDPSKIVARHLGTLPAQEDPPEQPIYAD